MSLAAKSLSVLQREVVLFASNIVTGIVVARTLGPHFFGIWVILNMIPSYAETLGRVKADAAAIYYLGRGVHKLGDVVVALHMIALATSALIVVPALIWQMPLAEALFRADAVEAAPFVPIIMAQIPINFLYLNYTYLHIHREDAASLNAMVLTRALASAAVVLFSLLVLGLGLGGVIAGALTGPTLALALGISRFPRVKRTGPFLNLPVLRDLLTYGFRLYLGTMVSTLNTYSSQALVVAYCAPAKVAFFAVAQQLSQLINKITEAMGVFLFPRLAREACGQEASLLAARAFRVAMLIIVPCITAAAILIHPAIVLLYGPSYAPVVTPFLILLPGVALAAIANTLSIYFQGIGRADLVPKIAVVPLACQLALGFVLLPILETTGAAIALSAALAATAAVQITVFLRISGTRLRQLRIRRADIDLVAGFMHQTIRGGLARVAGVRGH